MFRCATAAKILFDEVSTAFTPGKRYGLTGPNGAGKSTFMKLLSGELEPQKGTVVRPRKLGVLSQDQYAFDAHSAIDTVIMGNKRLWAAMQERDAIYEKADMTDEDGMKLGELEGIVGEEDGYTAESDAAILLDGLDIPEELHEQQNVRAARRTKSSRSARASTIRSSPSPAARRTHQQPRSWIRSTGCRDF